MTPSIESTLLAALRERVVVADGAMGTMLQAHDLSLDDFEGHEGCNEVLNVTRPDVVRPSLAPEDALAGAPESEQQRFSVPRILDQE